MLSRAVVLDLNSLFRLVPQRALIALLVSSMGAWKASLVAGRLERVL